MIYDKNASPNLMSDIVFMVQRASAETCGVAARTIARQTLRFLEIYPDNVKNTQLVQETVRDLCECLLSLREEITGTGEEILIKRDALDLLLVMSRELVYPQKKTKKVPGEPSTDLTRYA